MSRRFLSVPAIGVLATVDLSDALCGPDLPDDDQKLGGLMDRDGVVVARVSPEQKAVDRSRPGHPRHLRQARGRAWRS